ncbi:hypothetical protein GCM10010471_08290 [Leucobacter komagatae]
MPYRAVFTAPFDEEWTREVQELVRVLAPGQRVRVLLPDDIQMEDYAPAYEVTYGLAAADVLRDETTRTDAGESTLLVVDFAPQLWPDDDALLPELNAALAREWPPHLSLAVITPNNTGLEVNRFDACLELSTAFAGTSA